MSDIADIKALQAKVSELEERLDNVQQSLTLTLRSLGATIMGCEVMAATQTAHARRLESLEHPKAVDPIVFNTFHEE